MSVRKDLDSVIQSASLALGYPQLRSKQYDAVKSFLEGNDVFVVLPTGSGKSLCYSLLPLAFNTLLGRESSIVIVISPLKALMILWLSCCLFTLSVRERWASFREELSTSVLSSLCSFTLVKHRCLGNWRRKPSLGT